jgi:hypothetical protein
MLVNIDACIYYNHVKFQCIQAQTEKISTLAPFTGHSVWGQIKA